MPTRPCFLPLLWCRWGLIPSWTKPEEKHDHWKMFNARSETMQTKPVFSRLARTGAAAGEGDSRGRRCVCILSGFYEWKKEGNK